MSPAVPLGEERAMAAARELAARVDLPPGPAAVLDVGEAEIRVTVLTGPDGAALASGCMPAGPGWVTTSVELLTRAVAEAGRTPPTLTGGVLVIGERARDPELDRSLTDVCGEPPWHAGASDEQDQAAAGPGAAPGASHPPSDYRPVVTAARAAPSGSPERARLERPALREPARSLGEGLFPPSSPRRRIRTRLVTTAVIAAAGLIAGLVTARAAQPTAGPAPDIAALVQYDYALRLPAGWRHSGGLPERRRTLLTPAATPDGSDLVSIEQTPLGYDGTAEADRAHRELAMRFQQAADTDATLAGPLSSTSFGGRAVLTYRQALPRLGATVDWFVVFERDAQLSVGCQHTPSGADAVTAACAEVVASLRKR